MVNNKLSFVIVMVLSFVILLNSCQVSGNDITALNTCYDLSEQVFNNVLKTDDSENLSNRELFLYALENELYDTAFSKSKFNGREFYFSPGNKANTTTEYQKNRCKDTLIGMYLAYTLSNDKENFTKEFLLLYPQIDFYLTAHSEFVYLIVEHYDCTEDDIKIIIESYAQLSEQSAFTVDKYKALNTAYFIVSKYNKTHKNGSLKFPVELDEKLNEYLEYVMQNPEEVAFWTGYTIKGN